MKILLAVAGLFIFAGVSALGLHIYRRRERRRRIRARVDDIIHE